MFFYFLQTKNKKQFLVKVLLQANKEITFFKKSLNLKKKHLNLTSKF